MRNKPVTGLVIDDYGAPSSEDIQGARGSTYVENNRSRILLLIAKEAYKREGIIGSDDKEISDPLHYKVIAAEVNSAEHFAAQGMVSVGARQKKASG